MEHIKTENFGPSLTNKQHKHLAHCSECQQMQELMTQLNDCAGNLTLENPPLDVWHRIDHTRNRTDKSTKRFWGAISGIAASLFIAMFGWLSWNNMQLQNQFQEVLAINKTLEDQLNKQHTLNFIEANLYNELNDIETQLLESSNLKQKINTLNHRKNKIKKIIQIQKGSHDENYI